MLNAIFISLMLFSVSNAQANFNATTEVIQGINLDESVLKTVFKLPSGCTATFISPRMFITSAHCTKGRKAPRINGELAQIFNHPKYKPSNFRNRYYRDYYDVALGILAKDAIDSTIITAQICEIPADSKELIGKRVLLVGYGCNKWPSRSGGGKKRYGYSTLTTLEKDYMGAEDKLGGLSCPGDSGGPYFLVRENFTLCHLGTNFYSDRKKVNHATSSVSPGVQDFILKVATENNVEACGLTMTCDDLYVPTSLRELSLSF